MAAANADLHIRLLIPRQWISGGFGNEVVLEGKEESEGNYEVRTVSLTSERNCSTYFVRGLRRELLDFNPDIIFPVHESYQLLQSIIWRMLFAPRARLPFFTMDVHPRTARLALSFNPKKMLLNIFNWSSWWLVRHGTDAAICHYPGIEQQIRRDGYRQPVLIQTQIGVDEDAFFPEAAECESVRIQLGLDGFVVGFAGRVKADKGILDLAAAMSRLPKDVRLMVVGDGPDRTRVEEMANRAGWRNRLHLVGYVPFQDVARFTRAMDCLVAGSRTTETWTDTFPLVVAQAMATGIPVVGSDSGAIPFQLGGQGLVFHEGDADALAAHILSLRGDPALCKRMGQASLKRAREEFCIGGINPKLRSFLLSLVKTPPRQSLLWRLASLNAEKVHRNGRFALQHARCRTERLLGRAYPRRIDAITTHMTTLEKQTLFRHARHLSRGSVAAEIGSYYGASSCCIAAGIKGRGGKVYCVDTWMNDAVTDDRADVFPVWQQNMAPYAGIAEAVRGYSYAVVEHVPDHLALLFVDGDHSYEGVKRDLRLYLPKIEPGGILIMHDWSHDSIRQAVHELVQPFEVEQLTMLPNLYCSRVAYRC
jgi:L-malate glycosyltransferase